ncbi:MAG: hypothetical protein ABI685_08830 [Ferruginibacter sp.]
MKKFKEVDAWISIILITGFAIATIINRDYTFILGYFIVGSWQVISMLVHVYCHSFTQKKGIRRNYHWITLISLITMPIGSFWILLFAAPFMAVFYTWLCFDEVRKMNQRPLALLK